MKSQIKSFPTVYSMPMPRNIGMSYIFGKLRIPAFQWAGGHIRVYGSGAHVARLEALACQSVFEVLGGKHQCSNLKDELCMFYYEIDLIPEQ